MILKAVDGLSGENVFSMACDTAIPMPSTGDLFVTPEGQQLRVLQRALIAFEIKPDGIKILDGKKAVDFEVQLATCPVGKEAEYADLMTGGQ